MRRARAAGALLAAAALAVAAPPIHAAGPSLPYPAWYSALPPASVAHSPRPRTVPHCRRPGLRCIDDLVRRLRVQWHALDARCDHRAVFSLAYLRITQRLRRALVRHEIRDPRWMEVVITDFSNHYLRYFRAYGAGRPVPESWRIAYDEDMHGDANAGQDTLLASNAHTQHDLPYIYAEIGVLDRRGRSHKVDHDAVNAINREVFRGLEDYDGAHYDPVMADFELAPLGLDQWGVLQAVQGWREGAWRNAERLLNARTPAELRRVEQSIDANANAWARLITAGDVPGYRAKRDAFCRAHRGRR